MGKVFSLFLVVPIYFLAMFILVFLAIMDYETTEFENRKLQISLNYATTAGASEMLETGDLGLDYVDMNEFYVNPQLALDAFTATLLLNYDMGVTQYEQVALQQESVPIFCVASYDGYYLYTNQRVNEEGDWELRSYPKRPYTYSEGGNLYALNLGFENVMCLNSSGVLSRVANPLSKTETMRVINATISDNLLWELDNATQHGNIRTVYIPYNMTTIRQTNPVEAPSVLAFVDNLGTVSWKKVNAFSIGGAMITQTRNVVCYYRNGTPYYCYADKLPESYREYIVDTFTSQHLAAREGWYCDPAFMA